MKSRGGGGAGRGEGNCLYKGIYIYVRKILGGFFDSNYKYGCGILANIINMDIRMVIFRLKNIDVVAKLG